MNTNRPALPLRSFDEAEESILCLGDVIEWANIDGVFVGAFLLDPEEHPERSEWYFPLIAFDGETHAPVIETHCSADDSVRSLRHLSDPEVDTRWLPDALATYVREAP